MKAYISPLYVASVAEQHIEWQVSPVGRKWSLGVKTEAEAEQMKRCFESFSPEQFVEFESLLPLGDC